MLKMPFLHMAVFRQRLRKQIGVFLFRQGASRPGSQQRQHQCDQFLHVFSPLWFNNMEVQFRHGHAAAKGRKQCLVAAFKDDELFDILLIAVRHRQNARTDGG